MPYTLLYLSDHESFDPTTLSGDVSFTQAELYGNWQKNLGRKVSRFVVKKDEEVVAYGQLILFALVLGKKYGYLPYGPVVKENSSELLLFLKKELQEVCRKENVVFIRLDFTPRTDTKIFSHAPAHTYHSAYFQPRVEWYLDIDKDADSLLMGMHEKTRYSIRTAERREISIEIVTENFTTYFNDFYRVMVETATRNGFSLHSKNYYAYIFETLTKDNGYLVIARYQQTILVIDFIIVFGKIAHYVFGGSSSKERNRLPTYLAQWRAILYAKELGCKHYNFGGIESGKLYRGWEGLTFFKKKFGGREVHHSPFFDVVASPFWYYLYTFRKLIKKIGL